MRPILSILVPTFNRASFVERLLSEIEIQLHECERGTHVEVAIGDNASDDATCHILASFSERNTRWKIFQNTSNLGAEGNILNLLAETHGKYRWIIGDDDLPAPGLLSYILGTVLSQSPSLIYLPSAWSPDILSLKTNPALQYGYHSLSSLTVARKLNIWVTFLSAWVFNSDQLFTGLSTMELISVGQGSSFIQLGWILPLLTCPQSRIFTLNQPCILATSGNTGGYAILSSFLVNYPRLVISHTTGLFRMRLALIGRPLRNYIPKLILSVRLGKTYRDSGQDAEVFSHCVKLLWYFPSFWLLCIPSFFIPLKLVRFLRSSIGRIKGRFQRIRRRN
jgi:glycosyltransferase involved in cell wall biosynthesis